MKTTHITRVLQFALLSTLTICAHAEIADFEKSLAISADKIEDDDVKGIRYAIGHVVISKGTLIIKGEKATLKFDADGFANVTVYAPIKGLVTLREKRNGDEDIWMEGEAADLITFDEKSSISILRSKVTIHTLLGSQATSEFHDQFISYNGKEDQLTSPNVDFNDNWKHAHSNYSGDKSVKLFQKIDSAKVATVSLQQLDATYIISPSEKWLRQSDCSVTTDNVSSITDLVSILRKDVVASETDRKPAYSYEDIFLTLADGTEVKLLFEAAFLNKENVGGAYFDNSAQGGVSLSAAKALRQDLIVWMSTIKTSGIQASCGLASPSVQSF